jgi:hypothetical protein
MKRKLIVLRLLSLSVMSPLFLIINKYVFLSGIIYNFKGFFYDNLIILMFNIVFWLILVILEALLAFVSFKIKNFDEMGLMENNIVSLLIFRGKYKKSIYNHFLKVVSMKIGLLIVSPLVIVMIILKKIAKKTYLALNIFLK